MGEKRRHDSDSGSGSGSESDTGKGKQAATEDYSDSDSLKSNEIVDVDFDFFDFQPADFHSLKPMLAASFGDDSDMFNLSELADMILYQNAIGSTVKVDGESDPYAFMSVLGMKQHKDREAIRQVREYLLKKAGRQRDQLGKLLDASNVGLLFNERVVNMPPQIVVPMLRMLMEETQRAVDAHEPFDFEYFVLLCPMYREVAADDSDTEEPPGKPGQEGLDAHGRVEDEFIEEFAHLKFDFKFSKLKRVADARNTFADTGLLPSRRCLVIHRSQISPIIARLESVLE
ncbi:Mss4p nuclear export [Coemansia sp. RSA 989]|nr:Mss4p nuclear export [Coemansia sp. RSA 1086]KAJ1862398.1 Mss4p nuclear export [Coemansia sp. RSA 989]KAJ2673482.1 Mss4p nuclear export [Coemansia sp. RSA 1085]